MGGKYETGLSLKVAIAVLLIFSATLPFPLFVNL